MNKYFSFENFIEDEVKLNSIINKKFDINRELDNFIYDEIRNFWYSNLFHIEKIYTILLDLNDNNLFFSNIMFGDFICIHINNNFRNVSRSKYLHNICINEIIYNSCGLYIKNYYKNHQKFIIGCRIYDITKNTITTIKDVTFKKIVNISINTDFIIYIRISKMRYIIVIVNNLILSYSNIRNFIVCNRNK
jgi:hypothetical protein